MKPLLIIYIAWNVIVYIVYGYDKWQSKHGGWRVPENTLLGMAFCLGGVGAWIGMQSFRHKTKHKLFTIGVPICIAINFILIYLIFGYNLANYL